MQAVGSTGRHSRRSGQSRSSNIHSNSTWTAGTSHLGTKQQQRGQGDKSSGKTGAYRRLKVATLNCRSTLNRGQLYELASGCKRLKIDVVALQEHRRQTTGAEVDELEIEDGLLIFSTATRSGQGGVGLFLSKHVKQRLLWHERVSDRILAVHLNANPVVTIISAYSPTNYPGNDAEEIKVREDFYSCLETFIANLPPHNMVILAADFNARLGFDSHVSSPGTVGPHCFHLDTNENGSLLTSMCESTRLSAGLSRFCHREGRLWTWRHSTGAKAQLDNILVRTKWINSMRNCRAYSTLNLGSDHRMVCAEFRLSLREPPKLGPRAASIDWDKLKEPEVQARFNLEVRNRFEALRDETNELREQANSTQKEYDDLLSSIEMSALEVIGPKTRTKLPHWVSARSRKLLAEKEEAHRELAPERAPESERVKSLKERVKSLAQEVTESLTRTI